jgi:hypothetical protein
MNSSDMPVGYSGLLFHGVDFIAPGPSNAIWTTVHLGGVLVDFAAEGS